MNGDTYSERQNLLDAQYRDALDIWIQSVSASDLQKLHAAGIVARDRTTGKLHGVTEDAPIKDLGRKEDAATSFGNTTAMAEWEDVAGKVDGLPDLLQEHFGLSAAQSARIAEWHAGRVRNEVKRETALQLARIIGFYVQPGNVAVRTHALAHAARLASLSGFTSLRHSSRILGVSVEAIRKVAWRWVELLGLLPLEGSKSAEARKSYSDDKKTNHWRKQKCQKDKLIKQ